jgi:hypothetical protein
MEPSEIREQPCRVAFSFSSCFAQCATGVAAEASLSRISLGSIPGYSLGRRASHNTMTKSKSDSTGANGKASPSALIDAKIAALGDWRGETLARVRALIREADPAVVEEVKWRKPSNPLGVPVWEHAGIICTGETYKDKVKLTFARGAALEDPAGLFNSSLDGNVRRAIDFREGDTIDEKALQALIRAAAALNISTRAARPVRSRKSA